MLSGRVKRTVKLPTEAEWEYACRAGTTTPFNFGSKLDGDLANCDGNYPYGTGVKGVNMGRTVKVGSYPANPWGLYDMHGNVWEWCGDNYGPYSKLENLKDPFQSTKLADEDRVARGGSWDDLASVCRATKRGYARHVACFCYFGFRVCFCLD